MGAQRHAVDQIVDAVPGLPALDGPVPLMVEQLVDVLQILDALIPVAEQVIDLPKFFVERIPPRTSVREPQVAEQLVEVFTIISYSSLREIVEQNVDIPVPHGRDGGEGLLGLHPGQSSTAFNGADHRSVTAEQIVDISAPRGGRVLHRASSSSGLPGTANQGGFRTFPQVKKVRRLLRTRGRNCSPSRAHPRGLLSWRTPLSGCGSGIDDAGKSLLLEQTHFRATVWKPPPGVKLVWIGERNEEGLVWYWHRDTRLSTYDLPPLPPG